MSVDIEPAELSFRRPFKDEITELLKIRNPNPNPVAFKVKTTAPKQYCVRPNSGRIEPGHDIEVSVALQAMKQEPPADTKCRDKFLVQSVSITSDKEFVNVTSILDTADKSTVVERKIRVNWLSADDAVPVAAATPSRHSMAIGSDQTPDVGRFSSPGQEADSAPPQYELHKSPTEPTTDSMTIPATGASFSATELTYEELKVRLEQAEDKIRLYTTKELSGLRKQGEKAVAASEKAGKQAVAGVQAAGDAVGVPVQIVAALCFLSFILAYLFF